MLQLLRLEVDFVTGALTIPQLFMQYWYTTVIERERKELGAIVLMITVKEFHNILLDYSEDIFH